ncbi:uncharacterized protein TNCV_4503001 [Trichonephila clavipes]|nr:uncharacterized protein TNCV_4503001 [Trichonephila clavipes]
MPNSPSQMSPNMLDWRQIWGSDRPMKGSNSVDTILCHPSRIESGFSAKDDLFPFRCSQFSRARQHSKQRRRWLNVKDSTLNGHRDDTYPSARCRRMVREDIGTPNEGATCAWEVADEAVGCTRAFLTMWWSSRRLVYQGRPETGLHVNNISRIHWSQTLLTAQLERLI